MERKRVNVVFPFRLPSVGAMLSLAFAHLSFGSDLLVGVKHHSDGHAHGSGGEVLGESDADGAVVAVAGNDLAPCAFVSLAGVGVLALVNVSDALSVVELGRRAINATLNVDECLSGVLKSLTASETRENSFLVESVTNIGGQRNDNFLT